MISQSCHPALRGTLLLASLLVGSTALLQAQQPGTARHMPRLHHVGLNSVDPGRAIEWYLRIWPTARRTTVAGQPGVQAEMLILFNKVDTPPSGAWRDELHRADPQSAFWHIGAFTNTTSLAERLQPAGITSLPLYASPEDTVGFWRSGLVPYAGMRTRSQLAGVAPAPPREGGFSYVAAPDGVLFEFTGGPGATESLSHVHFYHEHPLCAANWYVQHLGMELPPVRDDAGRETPRPAWNPCVVPYGEATWPSLEPVGTIRQPVGNVRYGNGAMAWYPRQCVAGRCGQDRPLVRSRGQALDHVAFTVSNLDSLVATLRQANVTLLEGPYPFGTGRAFMIEDLDGLAIEIIQDQDTTPPNSGGRQ